MTTIMSDSETINGAQNDVTFIFAHGAGAGMDHAFMESIAIQLAEKGVKVVRFDFPYMIKQKQESKKRPPDRAPKLIAAFEEVIEKHASDGPVFIGGKSMGGRIASHLADNENVRAIACLGFPFHPPGKTDKLKGEHLAELTKPCLILQGDRDTFGNRSEVETMSFSKTTQVEFIPDGDHSFKPRKASGYTEEQNRELAAEHLYQFISEVINEK